MTTMKIGVMGAGLLDELVHGLLDRILRADGAARQHALEEHLVLRR
jgi:hypothetical protein